MFGALVILVICGIAAFFYEGEFINAASSEISMSPWFYVSVIFVIFSSAIVFTPFSYGISFYFLNSKTDSARFSDIFYLFRKPKLLFRAIITDTLRRFIISIYRMFILLTAALIEVVLLAYFKTDTYSFVILHIIAWSGVVFLLFLVKMNYILCKYVLIMNNDAGVIFCIRTGRRAIKGRVFTVIRFYIRYLAIYIFTFLTLGLYGAKRINKNRDSFSTYAVRLVSES